MAESILVVKSKAFANTNVQEAGYECFKHTSGDGFEKQVS